VPLVIGGFEVFSAASAAELVRSTAEGTQMVRRAFPILACLAVLPLTSCNKRSSQAVGPSCSIESVREHKLDDGTELRVWNLKANGLKELTARLLIAADGKVHPASEVVYKWDKWDPATPAATGQLVLLIQDGKAFGVSGKRLPLISLDFYGSPPHVRTGTKTGLLLEGELHSRISTSAGQGTELGQQRLIYAQLFVPKPDSPGGELSTYVESLAAASKDGRTVLAVALEWAPQ
jgi:hypothetical protein